MDPTLDKKVRQIQQEAYIRLLRVVCAQPFDWVRCCPRQGIRSPASRCESLRVMRSRSTRTARCHNCLFVLLIVSRASLAQDTEALLTKTRKLLKISNDEHAAFMKDCRPGGKYAIGSEANRGSTPPGSYRWVLVWWHLSTLTQHFGHHCGWLDTQQGVLEAIGAFKADRRHGAQGISARHVQCEDEWKRLRLARRYVSRRRHVWAARPSGHASIRGYSWRTSHGQWASRHSAHHDALSR
jgi:hypothetical protein